MTKKEIVRLIAERADVPQIKTKKIVQWTFEAIIDTLIQEGRIELRNFGVFEVKKRKARQARNPRKPAEPVMVEAKNVVTFQPGKEMAERVRLDSKPYTPKRKKVKEQPKPQPTKPTKGKTAPLPHASKEPILVGAGIGSSPDGMKEE